MNEGITLFGRKFVKKDVKFVLLVVAGIVVAATFYEPILNAFARLLVRIFHGA